MSLLDKIREAASQDVKSIYVEAWDETIWIKPLTAGEVSKMQKKHPDFLSHTSLEAMADLIIMKVLDKDGEKALTLEAKPDLLRNHPTVVASVAGQILGPDVNEDHEKN